MVHLPKSGERHPRHAQEGQVAQDPRQCIRSRSLCGDGRLGKPRAVRHARWLLRVGGRMVQSVGPNAAGRRRPVGIGIIINPPLGFDDTVIRIILVELSIRGVESLAECIALLWSNGGTCANGKRARGTHGYARPDWPRARQKDVQSRRRSQRGQAEQRPQRWRRHALNGSFPSQVCRPADLE
eukprot:scaffold4869_cov123-Isochrysis_galbana.AAC.5